MLSGYNHSSHHSRLAPALVERHRGFRPGGREERKQHLYHTCECAHWGGGVCACVPILLLCVCVLCYPRVRAGHIRDDPGWKLRGLRETSMSEPLHSAHAWLAPSPHLSSRSGKTPGEIRAERRDWRSSRRKRISKAINTGKFVSFSRSWKWPLKVLPVPHVCL